jgi:hypothetical protein
MAPPPAWRGRPGWHLYNFYTDIDNLDFSIARRLCRELGNFGKNPQLRASPG